MQSRAYLRKWIRAVERHGVMLLCLLVAAVAGYLVADDFGMTWDEHNQRNIGVWNANIANRHCGYPVAAMGVPGEETDRVHAPKAVPEGAERDSLFADRHYGPALELMLVAAEFVVGPTDTRDIFLLRRYLLHALFLAGTGMLYLLVYRLWARRDMALTAAAFLVVYPRIYAHSFYNTKDIGFLVACIFLAFTLERLLRKPSAGRMVLHAMTCGLALDIRIIAFLPILLSAGMQAWQVRVSSEAVERRQRLRLALSFPFLTWGFSLAFWPWMWDRPLGGYLEAVAMMAHYPWAGTILYLGEAIVPSQHLPWHYLPVWLGITLPPALLVGLALWVIPVRRREAPKPLVRAFLSFSLLMALLPPLATWAAGSSLYNAWRQMYFMYPFLVILAVGGLWRMGERWGFAVSRTVMGLHLVTMGWAMHALHPYGDLYFNPLAGSSPEQRFESDYWGSAYREGLLYILAQYPEGVRVLSFEQVITYAADLLPPEQRARIHFTEDPDEADVILTNYTLREATREEHLRRIGASDRREVHSVWRRGMKVLSVFGGRAQS